MNKNDQNVDDTFAGLFDSSLEETDSRAFPLGDKASDETVDATAWLQEYDDDDTSLNQHPAADELDLSALDELAPKQTRPPAQEHDAMWIQDDDTGPDFGSPGLDGDFDDRFDDDRVAISKTSERLFQHDQDEHPNRSSEAEAMAMAAFAAASESIQAARAKEAQEKAPPPPQQPAAKGKAGQSKAPKKAGAGPLPALALALSTLALAAGGGGAWLASRQAADIEALQVSLDQPPMAEELLELGDLQGLRESVGRMLDTVDRLERKQQEWEYQLATLQEQPLVNGENGLDPIGLQNRFAALEERQRSDAVTLRDMIDELDQRLTLSEKAWLDQQKLIDQQLSQWERKPPAVTPAAPVAPVAPPPAADPAPPATPPRDQTPRETPTPTRIERREAPAAPAPAPAPQPIKTQDYPPGSWVVNLSSMRQEAAVDQLIADLGRRGIDATKTRVNVKGREYYRVFVGGFADRGEARTFANTMKQEADFASAWLSRLP